jgi:hypothetical protein
MATHGTTMSLQDIEEALIQITKDGNMNPFMFRSWASNMERSIARFQRRGGKAGRKPGNSKGDKPRTDPKKGPGGGKAKGGMTEPKADPKPSRTESSKDEQKKSGLLKFLKSFNVSTPERLETKKARWKEDFIPFLASEDGESFYKKVQHSLNAPVEGSDDIPEKDRKAFIRRENIKALLTSADLDEFETNNSRAYFPAMAEKKPIQKITKGKAAKAGEETSSA